MKAWTWKEIYAISRDHNKAIEFREAYGLRGVLAMKIALIAAGEVDSGLCSRMYPRSSPPCEWCPVNYTGPCCAQIENYRTIAAAYLRACEKEGRYPAAE